MMSKKRYLWLAVTADEYELPLVIEDTAAALARRLGVSENTVRTVEYRGKKKGTEKREKDRCRALEPGTRSGKWRWMDERHTVPGKIKRYELLGRGILLPYERDDILLRGRL